VDIPALVPAEIAGVFTDGFWEQALEQADHKQSAGFITRTRPS